MILLFVTIGILGLMSQKEEISNLLKIFVVISSTEHNNVRRRENYVHIMINS